MDYSLNQVESLPESFTPGGVYFDKETGGVYVAQDSSTKKQFGGTVTGISAPQPAGSFTASNPGVNAVQKVSNTSSQGSTDVLTGIVYINGAKLIAMDDGETISYGSGLFNFLQSNLVQGKLFMLSTGSQGNTGFGGRPVSVEQQGSSLIISLVSHEAPYNKIIRWNVNSSNRVIRNDTVLSSITVDSSLSSTSTNPVQNKVINEALDGLAPVFLNMSLMNGGTIGADDLAKLKEPKSGRPLFFWNFSASTNQCLSATYNWNATKLYVTVFSPQPGKVRVENIVYSSNGAYEEKTSTEIILNGNGTKALMDNGSYKTISKIVIGRNDGLRVISPVQGYRFTRSGLITANPAVGDTLINYASDGSQLMIGEIIRVETSYIYTGNNTLLILTTSTT